MRKIRDIKMPTKSTGNINKLSKRNATIIDEKRIFQTRNLKILVSEHVAIKRY